MDCCLVENVPSVVETMNPCTFWHEQGNHFQFLSLQRSVMVAPWESEWPGICPAAHWSVIQEVLGDQTDNHLCVWTTGSWNTNLLKWDPFCVGILNKHQKEMLT